MAHLDRSSRKTITFLDNERLYFNLEGKLWARGLLINIYVVLTNYQIILKETCGASSVVCIPVTQIETVRLKRSTAQQISENDFSRGPEGGDYCELEVQSKGVWNRRILLPTDDACQRQLVHRVLRLLATVLPSRLDFKDFFAFAHAAPGVSGAPSSDQPSPTHGGLSEGASGSWRVGDAPLSRPRSRTIGSGGGAACTVCRPPPERSALLAEVSRQIAGCPQSVENMVRISRGNAGFNLCESYPEMACVPASISDANIAAIAPFRSKRRFPVISFIRGEPYDHTQANFCDAMYFEAPRKPSSHSATATGAVQHATANVQFLCRGGQPLRGVPNRRNATDEALLEALSGTFRGRRTTLSVLDCRPLRNSIGQIAKGGGFESHDSYRNIRFQNLGIDNVHGMRDSLEKLRCPDDDGGSFDGERWQSLLRDSKWHVHLDKIIASAMKVVSIMVDEGCSVFVHCTHGWDRTPQVTSLAMLLLDKYYRTLSGFMTLVELEWIQGGHRFADRCGNSGASAAESLARAGKTASSPIFIQWLDCVYQLWKMAPTAFEFNDLFLLYVAEHVYSARFGTFLCNSMSERSKHDIATRTRCLWAYILKTKKQTFANTLYEQHNPKVLRIHYHPSMLQFWHAHHLRPLCTGGDDMPVSMHDKLQSIGRVLHISAAAGEEPKTRLPPAPIDIHPRSFRRVMSSSTQHALPTHTQSQSDLVHNRYRPTSDSQQTYQVQPLDRVMSHSEAFAREVLDSIFELAWHVLLEKRMLAAAVRSGAGPGALLVSPRSPLTPFVNVNTIASARQRTDSTRRRQQWVPDALSRTCAVCLKTFSWLVRRHHCRICGHVVCASCSAHRLFVPHVSASRCVRACTPCFENCTGI